MASMLSTDDNPYNPYLNWDEWYQFDEDKGYHSCSYLGRLVKTVDNLSDKDYERMIDLAIDEIVKYNLTGTTANYIKVLPPGGS